MEMTGNRQIPAPPEVVWARLNDAETLRACIPGCTELTGTPQQGFAATVVQRIGPVKATFRGNVTLSDIVPGESYTITGEGSGGVAGFASGAAHVRLVSMDGGTDLSYTVEARVGGKIAQLGSRLIDGFARKVADQFFENLQSVFQDRSA